MTYMNKSGMAYTEFNDLDKFKFEESDDPHEFFED